MDNIILENVSIAGNTVVYRFSTSGKLKNFFHSNELWIDYNECVDDIPISILSIPFVSIMMPIIWVTDSVLWINELDKTFYDATFAIQRAFQNLFRKHPLKGRITPSYIKENEIPSSRYSIILFSGGVDAHTSYIRHKDDIVRLINIQGFYKDKFSTNIAAEADFRDISSFAVEQNKCFSFIKSNFGLIVNLKAYHCYAKVIGDTLWHGFQHSMAFISFSIPLAYKYKISTIFIASSFTVGDARVCASYPTTDNAFSFATNGHTIHDGFELTRQDKIHVISQYQQTLKRPYPIRVCSFNDHNCCECEKCFRTILGLTAEGADVSEFGFILNQPLARYWEDVMYRKGGLMGFKNEKISHWPFIIQRMKENYNNMNQEQKAFVDWFLTFDFNKAQNESRMRYYRQNFFSIIKRKLGL